MPGGGLYALVSYGSENILLNGNPDFTYFYKSYKKYSHFSEESMTLPMDGPQELSMSQPIKLRTKIQRNADLVSNMYLTVNLPDIYCKYVDINDPSENRSCQYNFNWTRYVGCRMIQNCALFIGGSKIQEFDGNYMIARAQCDFDNTQFQKWRKMVGDVPELYDPAQGMFAGGYSAGGYPIVFPDPSGNNLNRPSIYGRELQIPLPFYLGESTFNSLPLVALQLHECEVQITFRPINQLYQVLDPSGNHVAPGFIQDPLVASEPCNPTYIASPAGYPTNNIGVFLTDWGISQPLIPTWQLNPRLQCTYVYVTEDERRLFAQVPLTYLVRQITPYLTPGIVQNNLNIDIKTNGALARLIILQGRSDGNFRNDVVNYTNWLDPDVAPWIAPLTPGYSPFVLSSEATGRIIPGRDIIQTLKVIADGNDLQEMKPVQYFTDVVPYEFLNGRPDYGILVYPFSLTSPQYQPNGSINTSRINKLQVAIQVQPLLINTNYLYDVAIYVETYNWLIISSGMGGLKNAT